MISLELKLGSKGKRNDFVFLFTVLKGKVSKLSRKGGPLFLGRDVQIRSNEKIYKEK